MKPAALLCLFALFLSPAVRAQDDAPEKAALAKAMKLADALKYQDGEVTLRGDLAKLKLPRELRYLGPDDAATVLERIWGNPPSRAKTLGLLVPASIPIIAPNSWAVIITYEEDGYVKDDDATKINYDDLLKQMRADVKAGNAEREKQGYDSIELVGWAATPRYEAAAKKMYWAKELKFERAPENTLNYNIRVLGRRGVLVLNAVAGMAQLPDIEAATPSISRKATATPTSSPAMTKSPPTASPPSSPAASSRKPAFSKCSSPACSPRKSSSSSASSRSGERSKSSSGKSPTTRTRRRVGGR